MERDTRVEKIMNKDLP